MANGYQDYLDRIGQSGGVRPPAGQVPGGVRGGGNQGDVGFFDALTGDEMFTAGAGTWHGERAEFDKKQARLAGYQQQNLASEIGKRAMGFGGPSVAELQMQRGMNQAQQRLGQQAASARGMSRAGAQGAALRGASDLYSQTNEQAGIMRAQEQIAAQQLYGQQLRDMRQQDLLSRGYGIEEAKAILDAEMKAQGINADLANATAARRQGIAVAGIGAAAGLLSDERAKEFMYSDFRDKETLPMAVPGVPQAGAAPMFQPTLQVAPTEKLDDSVSEQQRSLGERAIAGAAGAPGSGSLGESAQAGFNIGSALGGLLSDFRTKELGKARIGKGRVFDTSPERVDRMGRFEVEAARERMRESQRKLEAGELWRKRSASAREIDAQNRGSYGAMSSDFRGKDAVTTGDLDQVARDAMLPFEEMNAQDSRDALGPVDPVVYRYKPEHSERMALETGANPAERSMVYADKRTPRLGIVAQDLQRSPAFDDSVMDTPAGLAVERDRALSTALGSLAGLDKRLRELEDVGDTQAGKIRGTSRERERMRRMYGGEGR